MEMTGSKSPIRDDDIFQQESGKDADGAVHIPPRDIDSTVRPIDIDSLRRDPLALVKELLSIAAAAVGIRKLIVEEEQGTYLPRPQLHVLISAPFGNLKSTILNGIIRSVACYRIDTATFPSLVGSIDWTKKEFVPAAAWKARNKILLLDEFNPYRDPKVNDAMLQLLEHGIYARDLGYSINLNREETDGDLYFKVTTNRLELKTRFSCILATMDNIRNIGDSEHLALVSRFVPLRYNLSIEQMNGILSGRDIVSIRPYQVQPEERIVLSDYQHIRQIVKTTLQSSGLPPDDQTQWYMRSIGDALRVYAVTRNFEIIPIIAKLKASIGDMR